MLNRIYWIAVSYLTWPLSIWLVVGGAVLASPILIAGPPHSTRDAMPLLALMVGLVLPAMGLAVQLCNQFRGPASRLMPGFAAPHALVAIALAVGMVGLMAARLMWEPGASPAGSILLPSALVSVVLASPIFMAAGQWHHAAGGRHHIQIQINPGSKRRIVAIILTIVVILLQVIAPVGLFFALYSRTLRPRLLAANDPVTVIVLAFIIAASIALTVWMLNRLVEWTSEAGSGGRRLPNAAFSWGQQTQGIEHEPLSGFGIGFGDRQGREIEELSHGGEPLTGWGRIRRWRLGNGFQWPLFFVFNIVVLIPAIVMSRILFGMWFNSIVLQPIPFMCLAMSGSTVGGRWRLRTQVLPLEILRPTSRASLQREWMWALLLDLVPDTIGFAALEAVVLNYDVPPLGMAWSRVPLDFLLLLPLGMCTAAGLASMVAVIRRTWLAALIGYILFILTLLANAWARTQSGPSSNLALLSRDGLEAFFWLPCLIGLGVALVMARRWRKVEIGAII